MNDAQISRSEASSPCCQSRREFVVALARTGMAISGCLLFSGLGKRHVAAAPAKSEPQSLPRLSSSARLEAKNKIMTIQGDGAACEVNETGARILALLDGQNSIARIAEKVFATKETAAACELQASVAEFVALLGAYGFLEAPFFATIVEVPCLENS